MTFWQQVAASFLGCAGAGALGFVVWFLQRWITKAPMSEGIARAKELAELRRSVQEMGLPGTPIETLLQQALAAIDPRRSPGLADDGVGEAIKHWMAAREAASDRVVGDGEGADKNNEMAEVFFALLNELLSLRFKNVIISQLAAPIAGAVLRCVPNSEQAVEAISSLHVHQLEELEETLLIMKEGPSVISPANAALGRHVLVNLQGVFIPIAKIANCSWAIPSETLSRIEALINDVCPVEVADQFEGREALDKLVGKVHDIAERFTESS